MRPRWTNSRRWRDDALVRAHPLTTVLLLATTFGATSAICGEAEKSGPSFPTIILRAKPRYLLGSSIIVTVTYKNDLPETDYFLLPKLSPRVARGPFSVRLVPRGKGRALSTKAITDLELLHEIGGSEMMRLPRGTERTMKLDLANLGLEVRAGTFALTFSLHREDAIETSNSVIIVLE